ncbi:MAG TPA: Sir2 family NAD-dependent protein deacetylase [Verrucomicrobiae bacterium]
MNRQDREKLVSLLRPAKRILIFTGAGVSTGSGIPDFRGPNGVWKKRQPVYYDDFIRSEKARIEHWDFKLEGWEGFRDAQPNEAHRAIVELEKAGRLEMLVTQNIDGLHAKAGNSAEKIIELHGTNLLIECLTCDERTDPQAHYDFFKRTRKPPMCHCGGLLKPATISFGQNLCERDIDQANLAAWRCDLVIALGSSLSVYPAATVPMVAARNGVPYVIINQGVTEHDHAREVSLRIEGDVRDYLPQAVTEIVS